MKKAVLFQRKAFIISKQVGQCLWQQKKQQIPPPILHYSYRLCLHKQRQTTRLLTTSHLHKSQQDLQQAFNLQESPAETHPTYQVSSLTKYSKYKRNFQSWGLFFKLVYQTFIPGDTCTSRDALLIYDKGKTNSLDEDLQPLIFQPWAHGRIELICRY